MSSLWFILMSFFQVTTEENFPVAFDSLCFFSCVVSGFSVKHIRPCSIFVCIQYGYIWSQWSYVFGISYFPLRLAACTWPAFPSFHAHAAAIWRLIIGLGASHVASYVTLLILYSGYLLCFILAIHFRIAKIKVFKGILDPNGLMWSCFKKLVKITC